MRIRIVEESYTPWHGEVRRRRIIMCSGEFGTNKDGEWARSLDSARYTLMDLARRYSGPGVVYYHAYIGGKQVM